MELIHQTYAIGVPVNILNLYNKTRAVKMLPILNFPKTYITKYIISNLKKNGRKKKNHYHHHERACNKARAQFCTFSDVSSILTASTFSLASNFLASFKCAASADNRVPSVTMLRNLASDSVMPCMNKRQRLMTVGRRNKNLVYYINYHCQPQGPDCK